MSEHKYWSEMYVNLSDTPKTTEDSFIISLDPPPAYTDDKKVSISFGISPEEYEEVCNFYNRYNTMSSGNVTLMRPEDLKRYLSFDNISALLRSQVSQKLIGCAISLILPVRIGDQNGIISHGCTTFLLIHPSLRSHGLSMALIRGLTQRAYERGIYCDYHMIPFKLGSNDVPISSWFRPLKLKEAVELGFLYPDYNNPRSTRNRLKYHTRLPDKTGYQRIDGMIIQKNNNNAEQSLELYKEWTKDKKFVFSPDEIMWTKWVQEFPTYLIFKEKLPIGIVSINPIHCIIKDTNQEGKLAMPMMCVGTDIKAILSVLINIAFNEGYPVLYIHEQGNLTTEVLESVGSLKLVSNMFFSLYNNNIQLKSDDIFVPLI